MAFKKGDESNFSELERIEDKYILYLSELESIQAEIEKNLDPAYPDKKTEYVMINTLYLDSPKLDFFRHHVYGMLERMKIRIRKYGPNGTWDSVNVFLEIKEKEHEDVRKYRVQLDSDNLKRVKSGLDLKFNTEFSKLNEPLITHAELKRYIERYNKIVMGFDISPVLSVTYKRLAYGKGPLRVTLDTNISAKSERIMPLSTAFKIKKAVDWKEVKGYGNRYDPKQNVIMEIKHNSQTLPVWLQKLLEERKLEPVKFSKYVYSAYKILSATMGED